MKGILIFTAKGIVCWVCSIGGAAIAAYAMGVDLYAKIIPSEQQLIMILVGLSCWVLAAFFTLLDKEDTE